jgi:hypothetical protein
MYGCTVNDNNSSPFYTRGGGICNWGYVTLTNCTVSRNRTVSGGGIYNGGNSQLISVTVVYNNSGGICNEGSISLKNSIAANNKVNSYEYGLDCVGTFDWVCYSLIEDTRDCTLTGFQQANIIGKDPVLGPLKNNGGPTSTHALLFGSPAIDAGNSSDLSKDQRGYKRPLNIPGIANVSDGADIGAYEFVAYHSTIGGGFFTGSRDRGLSAITNSSFSPGKETVKQ